MESHTESQPDIERLVAAIDELIALCEKLQEENERLRALNTRLQAERHKLLQKNQMSQDKIAGMITRLKALEVEL